MPAPCTLSGFQSRSVRTVRGDIFVHWAGSGPPLLLLHGFPETSLMWHMVAPRLATEFTVIAADLPGYGHSGCPADLPDHAQMSKRAMALTLVAAMHELGHDRSPLRAMIAAAASPIAPRSTIPIASPRWPCWT